MTEPVQNALPVTREEVISLIRDYGFQDVPAIFGVPQAADAILSRLPPVVGWTLDSIYRAGMDADLPPHMQWGADAMEQYRFGKRRAVEEILQVLSAAPPARG